MNGNGANPIPVSDALHEQAARGVEAIHMIVQQRDQLLNDNDRMQSDLSLMRERNTQLEMRLTETTAERDHFMRYCTELTTKLNDIQMLILNTVEVAKHAAYRPTRVTAAKDAPDIDTKGIEKLIARLPQNGGEITSPS